MLIPVISFLIIVHFKEVQSFEAELVNGSLIIADFDKACESFGYVLSHTKKLEVEELKFSVIGKLDSIFESILEVFCPYIGYYQINETLEVDSTAPDTLADRRPEEFRKDNNVSESFDMETKSTIKYSISTDKNTSISDVKTDILPSSNITTTSTKQIIKTEPMVASKETTPNTISDSSYIVENVTESINSSFEILNDTAGKDNISSADVLSFSDILTNTTISDSETVEHMEKTTDTKLVKNVTESMTPKSESEVKDINVTVALDISTISDIVTQTTVALSDSESTKLNVTMGIKSMFVENVTQTKIPKVHTDINSKIEVVSTTDITKHVDEIKNTSTYEYNTDETSTIKILPEIVTTEPTLVSLRYASKIKSMFVENVTTTIPKVQTDINSEIEVVSITDITKDADEIKNTSTYEYNTDETSTIEILPEIVTTESTLVSLRYSSKNIDNKSTESDRDDKTDDISATPEEITTNTKATNSTPTLVTILSRGTKSKDDATIVSEESTTSKYETHSVLLNASTLDPIDEYSTLDYDSTMDRIYNYSHYETDNYDDNVDTDNNDDTDESSNIINGTMIYKHNTKSVDERRIVIVILYVSILLALIVVWASKLLYRNQKGEYILPQNMDNENIELAANSD